MLREVSLRSATPIIHQMLQAKTTAFVTPLTSEVCLREEWSILTNYNILFFPASQVYNSYSLLS